MTSRPNRQLRRELESELRDIPVAPAPDDLLAKIRAEIPADLKAANSPEPPKKPRLLARYSGLRVAASIALAVVGVALAYRAMDRQVQRADEPVAAPAPLKSGKGVLLETAPVDQAADARQDKDEKLSSKGKTKEAGDERAAAANAAPGPGSESIGLEARASAPGRRSVDSFEAKVGSTNAVEVAAPKAAAPAAPPAARPDSPQVASERLASLGYLGSPKSEEQGRVSGIAGAAPAEPVGGASAESVSAPREETITITAESPLVDARAGAARKSRAARDSGELDKTPTASDPWVTLQSTPGVLTDRVEVRRNESGHTPSTGGAREPNDLPAGDMFFRPTETNPFVDAAEDRLSTFGLDVDTGSWTLARSYFDRGAVPPAEAIRVEEFVNAQSYDDPAPRRGDFTLVAEGSPSPFAPGDSYRLLRFAVKARELRAVDRKPANLTFVVDVSGSMNRENRLGLVKRALGLLLSELHGDDRVALVIYGTQGRVVLRHTRDHEAIREAIASLRPEGSTNAEEGLRFGYDLAGEAWQRDAINRVILCSDGVANVGATGPESILARIGSEARRGIELTTVGFGMGNYNDALMEQLADQGDGAYHYVDTLEEARRIFVDDLTGTLQTVAKDAKVQVEFDPRVVDRWRLLGYENRDVADRDFRNDSVDAGEIGVGHSAVALYEVRLKEGASDGDRVGTLRLRWKSRASKSVEEAELALHVGDLEGSFRRASSALRIAAVAAELAERLKHSYWAKDGSWDDLRRAAQRLESERGKSGRTLAEMISRAARSAGSGTREPDAEPPVEEREEY